MALKGSAFGWALAFTCAGIVSQAARAQESAAPLPAASAPLPDAGAAPARQTAGEEIVVTGSRVRRKDLTTPAPVTVISKEQISASGIASLGDFLQQMPEQGAGTNTNVNNGGDGETQISLRSLGAQRTLVLVDGKRWVNGGSGPGYGGVSGTAVDLNSIPTGAIERVEVLKDGASALYGSDAIGGVVNIITRRRVNGAALSVYAGTSPHADGQQYDLNLTAGASGEKGSFMFSAGYFDQKPLFAAKRDWAANAVAYDFPTGGVSPGGSGSIPQGRVRVDPSACPTQLCNDLAAKFGPGKKYFLPDIKSSASVDGWRLYDSSKDLYNYQAVNYLITPSTRISLFSNGEYHLSDNVRVYAQGSFVNRQSSYLLAAEPLTTGGFGVVIAKENQYNPFGVDLPDARRRLVETGGRSNGFDLDTIRAVAGLDGSLPESFGPLHGMFWDVAFNFGRNAGVTRTNGSLNTQLTGNGLGPSYQDATGWHCGTAASGPVAGCTPVNLFGGPGTITPAMLSALGGYEGINRGFNQLTQVQANVSEELFRIFAERPAGFAAGYEYRGEYGGYTPNSIAQQFLDSDFNGAPTQGSYHVNEAYAELDLPIVSGVAGADDLEVQLAARVFDYSTFGTDSTYKLGARWRPVRDVTLRGTFSTGFRAPAITDLYGGAGPSFQSASDPCGAIPAGNAALKAQCTAGPGGAGAVNNGDQSVQLATTVGGSRSLKPETARIGTFGVVLEPSMLPRFSLTADYWNVTINDNLGFNTAPVILAGCYPASTASAAPVSQAYCNLIQRSPLTGQISNINDFEANVGKTWTSGIDLAARYTVPLEEAGRVGLLLDGTYLLKYDYSTGTGAGETVYHAAGNYDLGSGSGIGGLTPRVKFNLGVNYTLAGFSAGARGRYIGGFTECADAIGGSNGTPGGGPGFCTNPALDGSGKPYPSREVSSSFTFDLFANYLLKSAFGSTTFAFGVRNVADRAPPKVYNSFLTYADPAYDFAGRFVYGRVTQQF